MDNKACSFETEVGLADYTSDCQLKSFVTKENVMWYIEISEPNWKLGKCSYPYFIKNFMCKHLISIYATLRINVCINLFLAKQIPLGQKRKITAPSKATPA